MKKLDKVYMGSELIDLREYFMSRGKSFNTAKAYASSLSNYMKQLGVNNVEYFKTTSAAKVISKIQELLKDQLSRRGQLFSAIMALYDYDKETADMYRDNIRTVIETNIEHYKDQTPTIKESENWVSQKEIKEVYDMLKANAEAIYKKSCISEEDYETIQKYVVLSLYIHIAPRRLMDYTMMCFDEPLERPHEVNYVDWKRKQFVFNVYKTAKKYEQQCVDIPAKLYDILEEWKRLNSYRLIDGEATIMLVDENEEPLESYQLNRLLNKIFGDKKVSCNMLRHSYISELLQDMPSIRSLDGVAKAMGHSIATQQLYKKNIE